jgi:hypothetical protein
MLTIFLEFIKRIITNPKVEAFAMIGLAQLIKKFMDEKNEEEIKESQPLHLPRGSVRALLTLILTLIIGGSFIWHYELPNEFYAMALLAIGYYIGYRTDNTQLPEIKQ